MGNSWARQKTERSEKDKEARKKLDISRHYQVYSGTHRLSVDQHKDSRRLGDNSPLVFNNSLTPSLPYLMHIYKTRCDENVNREKTILEWRFMGKPHYPRLIC